MGCEIHFEHSFERFLEEAFATGIRGSFVEGCSVGFANGLIYLSEAFLFWIAAMLVARGTYSYLQMVQVLQLVIFSVSISSQLLTFGTSFKR